MIPQGADCVVSPGSQAYVFRDPSPLLPISVGALRFGTLFHKDRNTFVELVSEEIGCRYPETGEAYARALLAATDGDLCSFGVSTSRKSIIACYGGSRLLGFTVATEKIDASVKFGPSIVVPSTRGHGIAVLLRLAAEDIYRSCGYINAYSTCQAGNLAARRYAEKAGYRVAAILPDQYASGSVELVLTKRLAAGTPSPQRGRGPLQTTTSRSYSEFGFCVKRGGAIKLHLGSLDHARRARLYSKPEDMLEEALSISEIRHARRLYLEVPILSPALRCLLRFGFVVESLADNSFTGRDLVVCGCNRG